MSDDQILLTLHDDIVARIEKEEGTEYSFLLLEPEEAQTWLDTIGSAVQVPE